MTQSPSVTPSHRNISAARLRHLLLAVEKIMDRSGLLAVLRQAQLERYIAELPPESEELSAYSHELAAVVNAIERYYGRNARGQLLRIGWAMFDQVLNSPEPAWAWLRFWRPLLGSERRQKRVLVLLAQYIGHPDGGVQIEYHGNMVILIDPQADEMLVGGQHTADSHLILGLLQGAMHWATGQDHQVLQQANRANGAPASRYEIRLLENADLPEPAPPPAD